MEERAATQTPWSTNETGDHSSMGCVTSYQVYPSADTGPPVIATIVPAASVPSLPAAASGPRRYDRSSTATRPNPPTASEGVASYTEATFQAPTWPFVSVARTRKAYPCP